MRALNFPRWTPVIVSWDDATTTAVCNFDTVDDALAAYVPARRRTIGYFLGWVKGALLVAHDDDRAITGVLGDNVGTLSAIPFVKNMTVTALEHAPSEERLRVLKSLGLSVANGSI